MKVYQKLLTTSPPEDIYFSYRLFGPLTDSLELAREMLPTLFHFLEKEDNRTSLLGVFSNLSYSNPGKRMLTEYSDKVFKYFEEDFQKIKHQVLVDSISISSTKFYQYLQLIQNIPVAPFTDSLTAFGLAHSSYYKASSMLIRINNHLPIEDSLLQKSFENWYYRKELVQALITSGQKERVPAQFLSMEGMGKLTLGYYLAENDELEPDSIRFLGTIEHGDSLLAAYFVEYVYDESGYSYLGLAGPFSKDGSSPQLDQLKAMIDWEGHDDSKDWKEAAEALKEDFEEEAY